MQVLSESSAAVVMSDRARLELDTADGFLPSNRVALNPENIHVIPHGAPALPAPSKQVG